VTFYNFYKSKGYSVKVLKLIRLETDIVFFGDDEFYLSKTDFNQMPGSNRSLFYLNAPSKVRDLIKKNHITHSIAFGDMANMFSSLTFTKEHKTASIHSMKSIEFESPTLLTRIFKLGLRTTYRSFDKVVCISGAIRKDLVEKCGYKFRNLEVIYNPHNFSDIYAKAEEPLETAENELFSKDVIMFLGRFSMVKALWHLIKAFNLISSQNLQARLVFIGDGDKNVEDYLKNLVQTLGIGSAVIFLGPKSNPYKYLKRSKMLVLSSYFEGTPNVIVEAIAVGVPVVTSNCTDGLTEIMSIGTPVKKDALLITESGIITPGFVNREMIDLPTDNDIIPEEREYAKALQLVLDDETFKGVLMQHQESLLKKFDIDAAAEKYLI